jgi:hypothetical protein
MHALHGQVINISLQQSVLLSGAIERLALEGEDKRHPDEERTRQADACPLRYVFHFSLSFNSACSFGSLDTHNKGDPKLSRYCKISGCSFRSLTAHPHFTASLIGVTFTGEAGPEASAKRAASIRKSERKRLTRLAGNYKHCPVSGEHGDLRFSGNRPPSRPCWRKTFAASVVILLAGLVWLSIGQVPREPVYLGKPLTLWLRNYASSSSSGRGSREWSQADDAVRHIGTNCIPMLLHILREKDSKVKLRLVALVEKQQLIKIHFVPAAERNGEASKAFLALGDRAKGAVPALVKMYNENTSADSQAAIEDSFAWIGPASKPAIPLLLRAATNSNPRVRANALWALGEIHAEPLLCVPELIHALSDSDDWARLSAAHALGMFGTDAQSAVLSLTELTNVHRGFKSPVNGGLQVMLEARKALKKIDGRVISPSSENFPEFGIPTADWPVSPQ